MFLFIMGFIFGCLVMHYFDNKTFKDKVNNSFKNILKKKEPPKE